MMKAERNGTLSSDFFTRTFKDSDGSKWICPDASIMMINLYPLYARAVPCETAKDAVYADNTTCDSSGLSSNGDLSVSMQIVSTFLNSE